LTVIILAAWFRHRHGRLGRVGFYLLFGLAVTASVQMSASILCSQPDHPALASRNATRLRLAKAYAVGALGYLFGLIASIVFDLPTGAIIVWAMAVVGSRFSAVERGRPRGRSLIVSSTITVLLYCQARRSGGRPFFCPRAPR